MPVFPHGVRFNAQLSPNLPRANNIVFQDYGGISMLGPATLGHFQDQYGHLIVPNQSPPTTTLISFGSAQEFPTGLGAGIYYNTHVPVPPDCLRGGVTV